MSAKSLMDEIRRNHYASKPKEPTPAEQPAESDKSVMPSSEKKVTRRRRLRTQLPEQPSGMYTVTIIGGLGLPGYPLNDGEKLAIAKLTPITIGT